MHVGQSTIGLQLTRKGHEDALPPVLPVGHVVLYRREDRSSAQREQHQAEAEAELLRICTRGKSC